MGRYQGAVARASLGRFNSGEKRGKKTKVVEISAKKPFFSFDNTFTRP